VCRGSGLRSVWGGSGQVRIQGSTPIPRLPPSRILGSFSSSNCVKSHHAPNRGDRHRGRLRLSVWTMAQSALCAGMLLTPSGDDNETLHSQCCLARRLLCIHSHGGECCRLRQGRISGWLCGTARRGGRASWLLRGCLPRWCLSRWCLPRWCLSSRRRGGISPILTFGLPRFLANCRTLQDEVSATASKLGSSPRPSRR
jgi:hypothetical protein